MSSDSRDVGKHGVSAPDREQAAGKDPSLCIAQSIIGSWSHVEIKWTTKFWNKCQMKILMCMRVMSSYVIVLQSCEVYPVVIIPKKTMENHRCWWVSQRFLWPFSSSQTVSLPEGTSSIVILGKTMSQTIPSRHHFYRWYGYHSQSWVVKMALFYPH